MPGVSSLILTLKAQPVEMTSDSCWHFHQYLNDLLNFELISHSQGSSCPLPLSLLSDESHGPGKKDFIDSLSVNGRKQRDQVEHLCPLHSGASIYTTCLSKLLLLSFISSQQQCTIFLSVIILKEMFSYVLFHFKVSGDPRRLRRPITVFTTPS